MTAPEAGGAAPFDPAPILSALERHGVEYVVIGGFAAVLYGATRPTRDVDVTPATTRDNLDRLAAALRELGARVRTDAEPDGLPFSASGESLAGQRMLNLQTHHGELDLAIRPAAFEGGYDDLAPRAGRRTIGGVEVLVAALQDVIRSKETAGRRKDQEALPELYRLAGTTHRPAAAGPRSEVTPANPPLTAAARIATARQQAAERRTDRA